MVGLTMSGIEPSMRWRTFCDEVSHGREIAFTRAGLTAATKLALLGKAADLAVA